MNIKQITFNITFIYSIVFSIESIMSFSHRTRAANQQTSFPELAGRSAREAASYIAARGLPICFGFYYDKANRFYSYFRFNSSSC